MPKIHPTAIVDEQAKIADDAEIGAFAIIESEVSIGAGTVIRPHAVVRRFTTMGRSNFVDSFTVLGGTPQDLSFDPAAETYLRIGDDNTFREGVTISRATTPGGATTIGNNTLWMANSHAGHDCTIGNDVVIVNAVLLAGHVTVGNKVILGGSAMAHQFTWIGESAMLQGRAGAGMHVAPFSMIADISKTVGLNVVGLRRDPALTPDDRRQIKEAFKITFSSRLTPSAAVAEMDACKEWGAPAGRFRDFIRRVVEAASPFKRGLCPLRRGIEQP